MPETLGLFSCSSEWATFNFLYFNMEEDTAWKRNQGTWLSKIGFTLYHMIGDLLGMTKNKYNT